MFFQVRLPKAVASLTLANVRTRSNPTAREQFQGASGKNGAGVAHRVLDVFVTEIGA
jgi:hypothetical protein